MLRNILKRRYNLRKSTDENGNEVESIYVRNKPLITKGSDYYVFHNNDGSSYQFSNDGSVTYQGEEEDYSTQEDIDKLNSIKDIAFSRLKTIESDRRNKLHDRAGENSIMSRILNRRERKLGLVPRMN